MSRSPTKTWQTLRSISLGPYFGGSPWKPRSSFPLCGFLVLLKLPGQIRQTCKLFFFHIWVFCFLPKFFYLTIFVGTCFCWVRCWSSNGCSMCRLTIPSVPSLFKGLLLLWWWRWIPPLKLKGDLAKQVRASRWWFQIFFIFTPTWGRFPIWPIFFIWVETT